MNSSKKPKTASAATINTLIFFTIIVLALIFADLIRKSYESFFYTTLGVPQGKFKWLFIMMVITGLIFVFLLFVINKYNKDIDTESLILGAI